MVHGEDVPTCREHTPLPPLRGAARDCPRCGALTYIGTAYVLENKFDYALVQNAAGKFIDGTPIDGPASLRALLLKYQDAYIRNVTEKLLTYALGRGVEYQDMPLVRKIVRDAAPTNYRVSSLVMSIVTSDPFQMNMKVPAETQQAAR